jgi:peptidyl-prolyl cis-trans isomerase C
MRMVLSGVCLLAVTALYQGCQESNAPATGVKTEAKEEAKPAVKAEIKEVKPEAKAEVKEVKTETQTAAQETKPAATEVKVMVAEPNMAKVAAEDNGIAATVNGVVIKDADIDAKVDAYMQRAAAQIPPNMVEQYKTQIRGQALESMIVEQLLTEQIKKDGINITDKDVNDKLNEIIAAQPGGMTMESFKEMLAAQGQSFDMVKEQIKKTIGYEKLLGKVEVSDADAKAFYEENKADFNTPEQVKASHILVKVAPTATPEEKTAAKAKIDGLLKQVKAGGDFATLAKENSDCPSKVKGGDLGFFDRSSMVKEFADAAFAMKVGQVSNVVETQFGYHIIKVTDRKEGGLTSFDKAKADIVRSLQDKKKNELFKQLIDKVKAGAKIEYPPGKEPKPRMPMMQRPPRPNTQAPQSESAPK